MTRANRSLRMMMFSISVQPRVVGILRAGAALAGVAAGLGERGYRHAELVGICQEKLAAAGDAVGVDDDLLPARQRRRQRIPEQAEFRQACLPRYLLAVTALVRACRAG